MSRRRRNRTRRPSGNGEERPDKGLRGRARATKGRPYGLRSSVAGICLRQTAPRLGSPLPRMAPPYGGAILGTVYFNVNHRSVKYRKRHFPLEPQGFQAFFYALHCGFECSHLVFVIILLLFASFVNRTYATHISHPRMQLCRRRC